MNSYSLGISGNWFLVVLLVLIAVGISFWTYRRTVPEIPLNKKILLISFRIIAIFLLLFALFEPVLTMITGKSLPPGIVFLFDNSVSSSLKDAKTDRKQDYQSIINNIDFEKNKENSKYNLFDETVVQLNDFSFDSLNFKGQLTDISKAINFASVDAEKSNLKAVVLLTDGAFNTGSNPLYSAELLGKPIYVVGLGDSSFPKDLSVQSIITNEIAYINNPVPVNVNVRISGYESGEAKLTISDNNKKISEQNIFINPDINDYSAVIDYLPTEEGIRKITATISKADEEITEKNNSASEFIKVLKNKRKIALFAGSPSADVGFVKQVLAKEEGIEIAEYIQQVGAKFYNEPNASLLNDAEFFVLIGFPINTTPQNVLNLIAKELERGKSILFIAGQQTDYAKLKSLEQYLPFNTASSSPQEFLATLDVSPQSLSSSLLRVTGTDADIDYWNNLPPLFRTETFVRTKPESDFVAGFKVNNVVLKEPMILTRDFQNKKSVAFLGYGLYRWKLLGYAQDMSKGRTETPDLFSILVANSFKWLSINEKLKNVIIKTNKKIYASYEKVEFIASVYDAAYTPLDNCDLIVNLKSGNESRDIPLVNIGNGRYTGIIEGLESGDYNFSGTAKYKDRVIGTDNGRFNIGDLSAEYQNLQMNIGLLKELAIRTGGKFYTKDNVSQLINDINSHKKFKTKDVTVKSEFGIWNIWWVLAIALLLFSLEWVIRKRAGMI